MTAVLTLVVACLSTLLVNSTTNPKRKDHKLGIKASERQGIHQLVVLIVLLCKLLEMSAWHAMTG